MIISKNCFEAEEAFDQKKIIDLFPDAGSDHGKLIIGQFENFWYTALANQGRRRRIDRTPGLRTAILQKPLRSRQTRRQTRLGVAQGKDRERLERIRGRNQGRVEAEQETS